MKSQYLVSCELLRDTIESAYGYPSNIDAARNLQELEYKNTEHFDLYKIFLDNPEYMLKRLGISGATT